MLSSFWKNLTLICFLLSCHTLSLTAELEIAQDLMQGIFAEGITVDLKEPTFCEGVLMTTKGGVISGPNIRIQAKEITYTRKVVEGIPLLTIIAEGDLMVEVREYFFIGQRLEYDFQSKTGTIFHGRTKMDPWYVGGLEIHIQENGSFFFKEAYITTSEDEIPDWRLVAKKAMLTDMRFLEARNVQLQLYQTPVFWIPRYRLDAESIFDSPIKYRFKWSREEGPRFGITYEAFSWNRHKTFLRFDYRLNRGPGGGVETRYFSADHKTILNTINYIARDSSVANPNRRLRYRFQGIYQDVIANDKVTVDLTYDKLSDRDMATDYNDRGLELDTAGKTQLDLRRQEDIWIANFRTHVRVNDFQTVKQELPTLETTLHPLAIGNTGIITDNLFKVSYLDFVYANIQEYDKDYQSSRIEWTTRFYRPINLSPIYLTPEAGATTIYYGNTPEDRPRNLFVGKLSCELNTPFFRYYLNSKHVMIPYVRYDYLTFPNVSPNEHYIFDIEDGWYRLETVRFGMRQSLYRKNNEDLLDRFLFLDIFSYAFIKTDTIPLTVPKVYADLVFMPSTRVRYSFGTAWDNQHNQWDHFNIRTQLTIGTNFAAAVEYRHRNAYSWRKSEYLNFILDSYRTVEQLRHSALSDKRDTALIHLFYRFHPNWAIEFETRRGWNRPFERPYAEYELDLIAWLHSASQIRFSYQRTEDEHRVAMFFSVGLTRPDRKSCTQTPSLDY